MKKKNHLPLCAVLLAGGRGTRFWPRSRTRTPKQLLNIAGPQTMLRDSVARLEPLFDAKNFWAVTNVEQAAGVRREMRIASSHHVLAEPAGRNTAAAIGLAAIHLAHEHGDAIMAVLSADSYIAHAAKFRTLLRAALENASTPGHLVVVGVPPTIPETGYGYIELGPVVARPRGIKAYAVKRFTEKPALPLARRYVASGRYLWNAGMFFWRVSTFLENLERYVPTTHAALLELAKTIGTRKYQSALASIYPKLENISVDYAIMEPATRAAKNHVSVIPASVGWSDIGSWSAVYDLLTKTHGTNLAAADCFTHDAEGNYFHSHKFVAAIGVNNLVLVETDDAILICPRDRAQDVGKIVKWLEQEKRGHLL
jgi:mannose-1-phosphate guanylyltransferase